MKFEAFLAVNLKAPRIERTEARKLERKREDSGLKGIRKGSIIPWTYKASIRVSTEICSREPSVCASMHVGD